MRNPYARCHKGIYVPKFPEKYIGNVRQIVFRSLPERKMMRYLDMTESVLKWASEEFSIPYMFPVDNKIHRYYPDFFAEIQTKDSVKKYVIEIKPKTQTVPPKRKTKSYYDQVETYIKNQAKWEAAKLFCEERKLEFLILAV